MKRNRIGREVPGVRLDMTPMIDVVFNLLIFFMCTLSFVTLEGQLSSTLPKGEGQAVTPSTPLEKMSLQISYDAARDAAVYRAGSQVLERPEEILTALRRYGRITPGKPVEIRPSRDVPYRYVVLALDLCREAGLEDVQFAAVDNLKD